MRLTPTWFLCFTIACAGTATPVDPPASTPASFENPGGMWMPWQLAERGDLLRSIGLDMEPKELADPLGQPLAAIVSLGGCSASFVSPEGLIITNHHCVQRALQYHSTPENNLAKNGFLAATRADEKWNGPGSRVYVSQRFTDVTDKMLQDIDQVADPRQRYDMLEKRRKQLVAACEKDRPHMRCKVSSYFRGAMHYLIEKMQIRDVRLVYAPDSGIGYFGGDEDNWMWPRHTGDFSFYRAYVGKDGKPADYSPDNVPYRPQHHLKIAQAPLRPDDYVMVAGFPGYTSRYKTAAEVADAVEWSYPRRISALQEYIETTQKVARQSKEIAIKAFPRIMGMENQLKKSVGVAKGLMSGGLLERKRELERELVAWIEADAARKARYGTVLADMERLDAERRITRERDSAIGALRYSTMLGAASTIVQMAEERPKADADREPWLQERNWARIRSRQKSLERRYDRHLDQAMLSLALRRAARKPDVNRDWLVMALGEGARTGAIDDTLIEQVVTAMYDKSGLADAKLRLDLLDNATVESLQASQDPFIKLALAMRPLEETIEERSKRHSGAKAVLQPLYIAALRDFHKGAMAPDANGTLRMTYGTVRGYRPTADADMYQPFTTLTQMVAKHRGTAPFDVPERLQTAAKGPSVTAYTDSALGDVPVNFLSDLDITGGNSGSATLNGRGELVGLAFDTNLEAVASDWLFMDEFNRTIHVDVRYILWVMDAVDRAHHLMREMGVSPRSGEGGGPVLSPSSP